MFLPRQRRHQKSLLLLLIIITLILIIASAFWISRKQSKSRAVNPVLLVNKPTNWVYRDKKKDYLKLVTQPGIEIRPSDEAVFVAENLSLEEVETNFFRYLVTKDVICHGDRRLGNQHEGGWNVCLSPPFTMKKPCLVYSFGIGNDWRFEDDMFDLYGCQVMAFDPSIHLQEHNRTESIWFKPLGLAHKNIVTDDKWKLKTFKQHLKDGHHSKTVIDYFKFDIEYMEWSVILNMLVDNSLHNVKQLAFEMHLKHPTKTASKDLDISKSEFLDKFKVLKLLEDAGFSKFNYRLNPFCGYVSNVTHFSRSRCYELYYLNMRFVRKEHLRRRKENNMPFLA